MQLQWSKLLQRTIRYLWHGPSSLPQALQLEWRLVAIRWFGILFVAPGLLLAHLSPPRLLATYGVLVLASIYNFAIQRTMRRWPDLFVSGYVTAIGDSLLNIAMINLGGGFNSPFYYLLFTVTISAAMRYGYGPSLATVLIFVSLDAVESLPHGLVGATFVFRSGFLSITAVLAGYLREQAQRAEQALEERLRQANLLNEATATLGASLQYEPALHDVAAAACHLFGGVYAIIQPATEEEPATSASPIRFQRSTAPIDFVLDSELAALCRQPLRRGLETRPHSHQCATVKMKNGHSAILLMLARPNWQVALVTLAVLLPDDRPAPRLDPDILDSFAERTTLAIENAGLYRTLASRSDDLQRAYADLATAHQELLSVDEMKTNFLANVSHELRTPLSSIRSFSELLLSYEDEPAVQDEFLQIINSESERLTRLVNDVLDITKIESGNMDWHMTMVDMAALVKETSRTYATLIAEQHLQFHEEVEGDLPHIYIDRDRLQQVIGNLLNNAVKFTPAGTISLRVFCNGEEIQISVSDTGIGVPLEDQDRIFEKFQQVGDTLTDKPRGTGLGLCICRDIVEHHQGRLWLESKPGVGSTFTVSLPVASSVTGTAEEKGQAA